jgi:hypothetical protein
MSAVRYACLALVLCLTQIVRAQDVSSGPEKGKNVPELKVYDVTGENKDKELNYVKERKDKTTVYLVIHASKFDRPMAQFMKKLDETVAKDEGVYVVAVWLTDDTDKTKNYLPKAQQSLQFNNTALTYFPGDKEGPKDWNINGDAHLTAVVAHNGKVVALFGYQSLNGTNVPAVAEAYRKARKK